MNKLAGGIIGVLVVAVAGVTGTAYWAGTKAERWYEEALAEGAKSGNVKLSTVRYQRGLFSSEILTRVDIPRSEDADSSDPSFAIRQTVYHGPIPFAGWGTPGIPMQLTGAVVRATLDPESSEWTRRLAKWYGGQEPVVAISQIDFDGASDTTMTMPALTLNDVEDVQRLNYSGLQGRFQMTPNNTVSQGQLTIAHLDMVNKPETAGEKSSATGEGLQLRDLAMTVNQRPGAFNLPLGETGFKIGELRAPDETTGSPMVITGLNITGTLTEQGPQQVAGELRIKAEQMTVDQQSGTGSLHLALRNLDGATLEKLQQWQEHASSQPDDPQALNQLLALVKTLLAGQPEFMLDTQGKMTQGDWQGKVTLNFQDFELAAAMQGPTGLLNALEKGVAELTASKALLERLLMEQAMDDLQARAEARGQSVDQATLENMATVQTVQQLQQMTAAGFVRLESDQYRMKARFADGKLWVNDQELSLTSPAGVEEPNVIEGQPPMQTPAQ